MENGSSGDFNRGVALVFVLALAGIATWAAFSTMRQSGSEGDGIGAIVALVFTIAFGACLVTVIKAIGKKDK